MSNLIKCPDCGTEISAKAAACVKCGSPIAKGQKASSEQTLSTVQHTRKSYKLQGLLIGVSIFAGIVCFIEDMTALGLTIWGIAIVWWAVVRMLVWWNHH